MVAEIVNSKASSEQSGALLYSLHGYYLRYDMQCK